jgi:hypothetical protein
MSSFIRFAKEVLRVIEWGNLLHLPLFGKEGDIASLWQREVRRAFLNNVTFLMVLLASFPIVLSDLYCMEAYQQRFSNPPSPPFSKGGISIRIPLKEYFTHSLTRRPAKKWHAMPLQS